MYPDNGNIIHVVLAVYDPKGTYSQHAGVVVASIFERTQSRVCVHILHDETLSNRNRSFFAETAELFAQKVEFHNVSENMDQLGEETIEITQKRYWSVGTLFRLAITDILPLDKVIYLDCDVVVNLDIRELWDISVEGFSFAGVVETHHRPFSSFTFGKRLMRCDVKKYINAGVLLMNIPRIKEKFDMRRAFEWFKRYRNYMEYPDQDMINSYFRGDIKFIDARFNNYTANRGGVQLSDVADSILHATLTKPWIEPRGSAVDYLYWRAFLKTPWGRLSPEELIDRMLEVFQKSPITHRRTGQCYRKVFHRLGKDIFFSDTLKTAASYLKLLFLEAKYYLTRGESKKK